MAVPVESLKDEKRFRLLYELHFGDVLPFVMEHIRRRGVASVLFLIINLAGLALVPVLIYLGLSSNWFPWQSILWQMPAGLFAGSILIIPVHELLHGLAYRLLGARKIIFGADMSQFIFFVTAREHPVSGMQLYFLALLPFLLINSGVLLLVYFLFPHWILFFAFLLLSHNLMCIGDFAIVNFAGLTRGRIISYDDPEKKICYFYGEITSDFPPNPPPS